MTNYAQITYTYTDGDSTTFTIPFSYIDEDYIDVYINNTATENYTIDTSSSQLTISDTLSEGDTILIQRVTPVDEALVIFSDVAFLKKSNLNLLYEHLLDLIQELNDGLNITTADYQALSASLSSLYEVVSALVSQADDLDLDVEGLSDSITSLQTLCTQAVEAASSANSAAESAQTSADNATASLANCADVNLSNLSDAGIAILEQYAGTGSGGTGSITLTIWEED